MPQIEECKTLGDLADTGFSFWKFSKSSKDAPFVEALFAEYTPGEITIAEDADKWLSFVPSKCVGRCSMYGDQLTKLCFDKSDPLFREIADEPFRSFSNSFGELDAKRLLTEQNYSLKDLNTVKMIIEMSDAKGVNILLSNPFDAGNRRFKKLGFDETKEFLEYINEKYDSGLLENDVKRLKADIDSLVSEFHEEYIQRQADRHDDFNIWDDIWDR